jgi:hypothetical protein
MEPMRTELMGETIENLPDSMYLGYWEDGTVVLPFSDPDSEIFFRVWEEMEGRMLVWVDVVGGYAYIEEKIQ